MRNPLIHGTRRAVSATSAVEVIGSTLQQIKTEDGLTWADLGELIGKSEDQVAKYATGIATMDAPTFLRCCERWNGRFANPVYALFDLHLGESASGKANDIPSNLIGMTHLSAHLQQAMLDHKITDEEIIAMHAYVEIVGALIDYLRKRYAEAMERRATERHK